MKQPGHEDLKYVCKKETYIWSKMLKIQWIKKCTLKPDDINAIEQ